MRQHRPNFVTRFVSAGESIFCEGDPPDCAYLVKFGKIEIARYEANRKLVLTTIGPNEIFGDYAFIDDSPRSATATAIEKCLLIAVPRDVFYKHQDSMDDFTREWIKRMVKRVRDLSARVDPREAKEIL